ncbi:MAG: GrpB family protein [Dehalococcoidia bacterium]
MSQDAPPLPIVIVDYDPRWPGMFAEESARIVDAIGEWLKGIQHIGSTSVPGLAAKPIVDIMPGLRSLDDAPQFVPAMEAIGYQYIPEYEDNLPERRYFVRPPGRGYHIERLFHVHAVETTSTFWQRHLAFRDNLRAHPDACEEYAALKRRLATEYGPDREGYTEAKSEFIRGIEEKAAAAPSPSSSAAERGTPIINQNSQ